MPLYAYACPDCAKERDEFRSVSARNDPLECECGVLMKKIIGGHRVIGDLEPYYDENLESPVKSRQHRAQLMKERGVYEKFGKGWM